MRSMNLASMSHVTDREQDVQDIPKCLDDDNQDAEEDEKSSSEANKWKKKDVAWKRCSSDWVSVR